MVGEKPWVKLSKFGMRISCDVTSRLRVLVVLCAQITMALDKNAQDDTKPGAEPVNLSTSLESDMAMLASLLTQPQDDLPESDADDPQVTELLKRLTAADGVAKGVEERLDGIIENLDLLLTALETESPDGQPVETAVMLSDKPDSAQSSRT